MAVNIPGLSLSVLRQQTSIKTGLPLLVSGRFTAFGMGVPAFIRVFLEGPSYDPQVRSFDTFASPFSGDYSVNVIAEKDGQYNVYAQAFPPPIVPTGPPFPDAILLLPAMAESTHPPLVVGTPFDGGVSALLPDGTTQQLTSPPLQPIEFRPSISLGAPSVYISGLGEAAPVAGIPYFPELPGAPAAPAPTAPTFAQAAIDSVFFSPSQINPGMEATGVAGWRNTSDSPALFDLVFYLISPQGVRYGPLQVNQDITANPQVPQTRNIRLGTGNLPSGVYSVGVEIYDSATGALVAAQTLPSRLEILEVAAPVIPTPPPPEVPAVPTTDIIGTPSLNLPRQLNVGDVWSGTFNVPTRGTVNYFAEAHLVLMDAVGSQYTVAQGGRTLLPGETLQVPVNYDTTGFPAGNYNLFIMVYDQAGQLIAQFPMGALSLIEAAVPELPTPPAPTIPTIPEAPTYPTADMFRAPSVNLPSQVEIGDLWAGNVSIPTQLPSALQGLPSLPIYPVNTRLQLQNPIGQLFTVGQYQPSFQPGQTINLPVNFDTSMLPREGVHNLILDITDPAGNTLFSNVIGALSALMPAAPPEIPTPPGVPTPSKFTDMVVNLGTTQVEVGGSVRIPFTYTHVGAAEVVVLRAAIGDARVAILGGFDEVWYADKTVSVPAHAVPTPISDSITVQITPKLADVGIYSVYAKVDGGIPRVISPILTNIVEVTAPPAPAPTLPRADIADFDFNLITLGPFDPGATASLIATGRYKGRSQGGRLTVELGTGIIGTFFSQFTLAQIPVTFNESYDWQNFSFRANFNIPDNVELGRTYNIRATIETFTEPTKETDTDYGVIEIKAGPTYPPSEFSNVQLALGYTVVDPGDLLEVTVRYSHIGQRDTARVYAALGKAFTTFGFDEMSHAETNQAVPDDSIIRTRQATVSIPIPSTLAPGAYDIYAKVDGEQSSPVVGQVYVAQVAPLPASEFSNVTVAYPTTPTRIGGRVALTVGFNHIGEGESEWLYASIGNDGVFGFDEILSARRAITVPGERSSTRHEETITIPITTAINPGTYDVYAKIGIGLRPRAISPTTRNVIRITG